jgi:N-methylhydantoinase A
MHELCTVLERKCRAALARSAPRDLPVANRFTADKRYIGQSYEIEVPLSLDAPDPIATVLAEFHRRYRELHGHDSLTDAVEFVNLRCVAACQPLPPIRAAQLPAGNSEPRGTRRVCFDPRQGFRRISVYSREDLGATAVIVGPAIIEQSDTTIVVYPGQTCRVADSGSLIIRWD